MSEFVVVTKFVRNGEYNTEGTGHQAEQGYRGDQHDGDITSTCQLILPLATCHSASMICVLCLCMLPALGGLGAGQEPFNIDGPGQRHTRPSGQINQTAGKIFRQY